MDGSKLQAKLLGETFKQASVITIDQLHDFYKTFQPSIKRSTLRWRIYELVRQGVLNNVGRGLYTLHPLREFRPEIPRHIKILHTPIVKEFPYATISTWTSEWLRKWLLHMPKSFFTIVEVESDALQHIFHFLQDSRRFVFLNSYPSLEMTGYHRDKVIVVKKLTSQSPLVEREGIAIPTIEKILVDLYIDSDAFPSMQGKDLKEIYKGVFHDFDVNTKSMFRYASRRGKLDEIVEFLHQLSEG